MPRKSLDNESWHVRVFSQASNPHSALLPCSEGVMPVMPSNMPWEAHCQENRGINAETNHTPKYILLNLESTRISGAYVLIILGHFQKCLTEYEKSFVIFLGNILV